MSSAPTGQMPRTLMQMAGASSEPPPLAETALVLIDCQREYVDGALPLTGIGPALAETAKVLAAARAAGAPVIHVVHRGRPAAAPSIPRDPTSPRPTRGRRWLVRALSKRRCPTPSPAPTYSKHWRTWDANSSSSPVFRRICASRPRYGWRSIWAMPRRSSPGPAPPATCPTAKAAWWRRPTCTGLRWRRYRTVSPWWWRTARPGSPCPALAFAAFAPHDRAGAAKRQRAGHHG